MSDSNKNTNLLWTGGWDSTFRLCQLIFVKRKKVQPFYIIDKNRRSFSKELETMDIIRAEIIEKTPSFEKLLNPTKIYDLYDIFEDNDITEKFNRLKQEPGVHLANQYEWLLKFASQIGLNDLEIGIQKGSNLQKIISPFMDMLLNEDGDCFYKISANFYEKDISIFKYLLFPILDFTKQDMKEYAANNSFIDIMNQTWFCFKPINDSACGLCNPCQYAIEEGMAYRLSKIARLRYRLKTIKIILKRFLKIIIPSKYHPKVKKIKEKISFYIDILTFRSKTKKIFFIKHGYKLNLKNPKSFNEKIVYKKLFDRNPLITLTTDKYRSRDYIRKKIGPKTENYLVPLFWVGEKAEDIPFDDLSGEFIIKPNHICGCYIIAENNKENKRYIIKDHSERHIFEDSKETKVKIVGYCKKWLNNLHGQTKYEWAYRNIKPLIIIEKLLKGKNGDKPNDYKFFMFHGKCKMINFCSNRFTNLGFMYYDQNWDLLPIVRGKSGLKIEKPQALSKMLWIAEKLSVEFDFVRIDLYLVDDNVYCGEITHYPSSGYLKISPVEFDFQLGSYW